MANDQRVTVCVTPDFDAVSLWMSWGARGARVLSRGEFGATTGAPRLLDLFDRLSIETTWFVPGHTADTWPAVTAEIAAHGHEIGNHGYLHELFDQLALDDARAVIRRANDTLERVTGTRPTGMRVPAGDFEGALLEVLVEEGFVYDSSLIGGVEPYWCRSADELHDDGPNVLGDRIDLVEFPIGFITNDFNHFEFNYANPLLVGHDTPSDVEEIWRSEFDYMHEHVPNGVMTLTLHPQCIGHGSRIAMLERFLRYCASQPGVRFTKLETAAREFRRHEAVARSG
jgi:peptidoglycan/xylan/chitin deacetylase (PgdA/CDA1 family)